MTVLAASPLTSDFSMGKPVRIRPSALCMDAAPVNNTSFDDEGLAEGHIKGSGKTTLGHGSNCADSLESADFQGYIPHRCYSFVENGVSSMIVFPADGMAGTDRKTHAPLGTNMTNELTETCEKTESHVPHSFFWNSKSSEELRMMKAYAKFLDEMFKTDVPAEERSSDEPGFLDPISPAEPNGYQPIYWSVDDLQAFEQKVIHGCEMVP
ncbi:hypothetical protein CLU79DRAFT_839117 [Phycomyces nitens]|nr:hypothetical protein CLU79DRAFT_839117 [Phycomyces nitens]